MSGLSYLGWLKALYRKRVIQKSAVQTEMVKLSDDDFVCLIKPSGAILNEGAFSDGNYFKNYSV